MKDLAFVRLLRHLFSVVITITVCVVALPRMMRAETADTSTVPCPVIADATDDTTAETTEPTAITTETSAPTAPTESSEQAETDAGSETSVSDSSPVAEVAAESGSAKIRLSEMLPNPAGVDTEGEFIELRNIGDAAGQLKGWRIESDRAKSYVFGDAIIDAGAYHSFSYSVTKLSLVNDIMTLTLYDDQNEIVDSVRYPAPVPDGKSYGFDDATGGWLWNPTPTPGVINAATTIAASATTIIASSVGTTVNDAEAGAAGGTAVSPAKLAAAVSSMKTTKPSVSASAVALSAAKKRVSLLSRVTTKSVETVSSGVIAISAIASVAEKQTQIAIADIDGLEDGDAVKIEGVVTLPTGRAGKSVFALQEGAGGVFVRIYGSPLPTLMSGTRVAVEGTVVRAGEDVTVKTSPKKISLLGPASIEYTPRGVDEIDGGDAGLAVTLTGTLAAKGSSWITLATDDASAEIKAVMPKGVPVGAATPGDRAEARGVVRMVAGSPQLFVLEQGGLAFSPKVEEKVLADARDGVGEEAAGEPASTTPPKTILIAGTRSQAAWVVPVGSVAVLGSVAGYVFWRRYRDPVVQTETYFDRDTV